MNHRSHPVDLLPAHALGALEPDQAAAVEAHLAGCPECARELVRWRRATEEIAGAAPPVVPSPALRQRVLAAAVPFAPSDALSDALSDAPSGDQGATARRDPAAAGADGHRPPPPGRSEPLLRSAPPRRGAARARSRSPLRWLPAAAAIAALALASWSLARQTRLAAELELAAAEAERLAADQQLLRGELARTRGRVAELSSTLELVSSPATRRIALAGLGSAPNAGATTLIDPARGTALFTARGLPAPPPGRTYQLWYITAERGPVSAGVFALDPDGRAELAVAGVPAPEAIQAWAVTVEPEGGVPQPTGEMVLKG
jgi:anti-sigma-K factor RskA